MGSRRSRRPLVHGHAIGAIGDTRKRSLYVQLSAKGWRKHEPVAVGHETPKLPWTLLSRRFGPRPYLPAAEALSIHPTVLRSIAPTPQPPAGSPGADTVVQLHRRTGNRRNTR
jgi:hypothetical protein